MPDIYQICILAILSIWGTILSTHLFLSIRFHLTKVEWFKWEPRDLWIGCYWNYKKPFEGYNRTVDAKILLYICIIPTRPIILHYLERNPRP